MARLCLDRDSISIAIIATPTESRQTVARIGYKEEESFAVLSGAFKTMKH
jgi:hypothetical protein